MAEIPNVVTGETIESEWGNAIRDRTVQRYATVTERSALHPSPTEGDLSYREDVDLVEVFNGTVWTPVASAIQMGGTSEAVSDTSLSGTWENGATVTFIKPAHWNTYEIMVWGGVNFVGLGELDATGAARASIAGVVGSQSQAFTTAINQGNFAQVHHRASGLSANAVLIIQYSGQATRNAKASSTLMYLVNRQT